MNAPVQLAAWERCKGIGINDTGRHADDLWRKKMFMRHLWLSQAMATECLRINRAKGFAESNDFIRRITDSLKVGGTGLLADMADDAFCNYADIKAKKSAEKIIYLGGYSEFGKNKLSAAIDTAKSICEKAGFEYPIEKISPCDDKETIKEKHIAALARVSCPKWWRRKVRVTAARKVEQVCRELGMVQRKKNCYVSDFTVHRRDQQKKRNEQLLLNLVATNEDNYSLTLQEASDAGVANPVNRFNELIVRMKGYEAIAKAIDCQGVFVTLTAPSQYHAVTEKGFKNAKFNGSTPSEVQDYLNGLWVKVRAAWARKGIKAFGFRIVEPHHDGTPHWHLWLFIKKEEVANAMAIFQKYAIAKDREELAGDITPRFLVKNLDGFSAAGYVVKYISKNLTGNGVGFDYESGGSAVSSAKRVEAWASTWGIRQFQQIGSVSVTVWREVRRARDVVSQIDEPTLWEISQACEAGDWERFVELMGGVFVDRDKQTLRPLMVLSDKEGQYGEHYKKIKGVIMRGVVQLVSRWHEWKIKRAAVVPGSSYAAKLRGWGRDFVGPDWVCWLEGREPPLLGLV